MTDLRDQLQASLGDAYTIERELSGGGMSRVFIADETSLGRRVVVKVLPSELSGSVAIARFRREISLAARLQHPHIVPVLAAGEIDGLPYYTMPFVDGESLRARLAHGELPIAEVTSIVCDVAQALEFAHSKGIAHRDVKPDNVLLAGTSALITDFGVAKALSDAAAGSGQLTATGLSLGTPAYMAPEQAAADPATDLRADIYAFGAMTYEMLAGHAPFAGRSPQAMLAAHAVETPTSIAVLRPSTPPPLAHLVMRCLEKRPGDRPQSATALVQALNAIAATTGATATDAARPARRRAMLTAGIVTAIVIGAVASGAWWRTHAKASGSELRSIAILPFENKSGDSTFDYLEDGITDHVRDALHAIPEVSVKARSSSQQLKGRSARAIGAQLGVGVVLQGTVSRSSSRLHVTVELVRASDEFALWSGTFDGQPTELAAMQDTIVRAVAGSLRLGGPTMRATAAGSRAARGTDDAEAYELFLRGRYAVDRFDLQRGEELLLAAVARDPRFARAYGYLAIAYDNSLVVGVASLDSSLAKSRAAAERALAIDSSVVEAYGAESIILASEMRFADAIKPLERALAIDSTNADLLTAYGGALTQLGHVSEGIEYGRRARERDPLSMVAIGTLSYSYEAARQYDAAITHLQAAIGLDRHVAIAWRQLGFLYAFGGHPDSAVAAFETGFKLDSVGFGGRSNLVFGYAAAGRWNDAAQQRALAEREGGGNSPSYYRMIAHLSFGDYVAAMTDLERGVTNREPLFTNISLPCDPLFDPLKSNPRFETLMKRLGLTACPASGTWPIAKRG